jgi:hypothetical protein
MQASERKLHLRLDTRGPHDAAVRRARREVIQQRGLASSRLAAKDEDSALAREDARDNVIEGLALAPTAAQRWTGVAAQCRHFAQANSASGLLATAPARLGHTTIHFSADVDCR